MKHTLIALALSAGMFATAQAAKLSFPDTATAKTTAKEQNKPALIIWYGSDWMPKVDSLCSKWESLKGMNLPVVLGQYDDCTGQEGDIRNKTLPIECYNLPIAVLMDAEGNFMARFSGKTAKNPEVLAQAVQALLPKVPEFTALVKEAHDKTGVEAATAAGKALEMLPMDSALAQKDLKTIINKQDPKDESKYRSLFAMDHLAMFKEINSLLKGGNDNDLKGDARDFEAAEAYVRKTLKNPKLQGERRQQWLAGLYYVQKEKGLSKGQRNLGPALASLKEIVKIAPKTQTGKGAARYIRYWDDSIPYTIKGYFYTNADHTLRFEKEWHVDVTSSIKGPGTYTFAMVPYQNGPIETSDFRLAVNGKVISRPAGDLPKNAMSVDFNVPTVPKGGKVEVWLKVKNNSGWLDGTGAIKMTKK